MQTVNCVNEIQTSESVRCKQLESIFDVPSMGKSMLRWQGEVPLDEIEWDVGLIVGSSGSGKSTIARHLFGERVDREPRWRAKSVIDDFGKRFTVEQIAAVLSSVGFNTIPAWLRPFRVLSTGEKFRAAIARRLLEYDSPIVVDEFTSVVDRQVAKITSYAVQKYVRRRKGMRFVAVSCHKDIVEWLQPDWVLDPGTMKFVRRRLRERPTIECVVSPIPYSAWRLFAPYHYMSAGLNKAARCWGLFVGSELVSFCGVLHRPHPRVKNLKGVSRLVTLPDWQGIGLAFVLVEAVGSVYRALGYNFKMYPAHPVLIRQFDRSPLWVLKKRPGDMFRCSRSIKHKVGEGRPCAVFLYVGPALDRSEAERAVSYWS